MPDSYLAISEIATDEHMTQRMYAAVTQQAHLGSATTGEFNPIGWVDNKRYLWASSPSWGEKWRYAQETHSEDPDYEPGKDEAVITDADILATVQSLAV